VTYTMGATWEKKQKRASKKKKSKKKCLQGCKACNQMRKRFLGTDGGYMGRSGTAKTVGDAGMHEKNKRFSTKGQQLRNLVRKTGVGLAGNTTFH